MNLSKIFTAISLLLVPVILLAQVPKVSYVTLNKSASYSGNPVLVYTGTDTMRSNERIVIYPEITYQTIAGIGGTFNEIGAEALMSIPVHEREAIMKNLFAGENAGFSICRTAIGSSDFGINAYSYSEVADDYDMKHFSIERDQRYMLPYLKMAYEFNPALKLFASPWSPPGWMKYSGVMDQGKTVPEGSNRLKQEPKIYLAYAKYLAKYIQAYQKEGVQVNLIHLQNEQDANTKYPSCKMPVEQMADLVQNYVRPYFKRNKINTELWAGTFRAAGELEGTRFMASPALYKGFDGIGVQYMDNKYIADLRTLNPAMKVMHTEANCYNGDNSINQARSRFNEVANYINGGAENFAYWNMILNETGLSGWDWKQNALITINRQTKKVTYNPDYAVMYLLSQFIKPGSVRTAHYSKSKSIVIQKGGEFILIIQNEKDQPQRKECRIVDKTYSFVLPPDALCALILK